MEQQIIIPKWKVIGKHDLFTIGEEFTMEKDDNGEWYKSRGDFTFYISHLIDQPDIFERLN